MLLMKIMKEMMTIDNFYPIRYKFIEQIVLKLYRDFCIQNFPVTISKLTEIFYSLNNCKIMTYKKFMKVNSCSFEDVVLICESASGCTHYDKTNNKYLVIYNDFPNNNNVEGRILWTLAHELGHVTEGHLPQISQTQIANNGFNNLTNQNLETEADYFAATLLSPFPLFDTLNINSPIDIQKKFGLSNQASIFRWKQFLTWKQTHFKTAWENDMKNLFKK